MEPDSLPQKIRSKRSLSRNSREAPYVIYPEILVIVDYDGYRYILIHLDKWFANFNVLVEFISNTNNVIIVFKAKCITHLARKLEQVNSRQII